MSRRTFDTDPGAGGEESEYLGLPFKSTACEDWYGFGDKRCPNRYVETGDLEKDIESLIKWIGHYSGHGRTGWFVWATDELAKKQNEKSKILAQQPPSIQLSSEINQILQKIESGQILIPDWFKNNVNWVKDGSITQDAFLQAYNHQVDAGNIHPPEPEPTVLLSANVKISFTNSKIGGFSSSIPIDDIGELQGLSNASNDWKYILIGSSTNQPISTLSELIMNINDLLPTVEPEPDSSITDNMVTQQMINFNIVNGRAVGSIKFVATNNFNPFWYGKNIVNVTQIKTPNGVVLLTKENRLNFTETEPDELISYDEDVKQNTRATVESFVWPSATTPSAFSKMGSWDISEAEPPKPIASGFMGAGAVGAIAGLVLLGFIIDHKVSKR